MDEMEMEFNEPEPESSEEGQDSGTSRNATFKTPMYINPLKLHPYLSYESSGYISASSPDLNSTTSSLPCSTKMTRRISNDSQLSVSPECSSMRSHLLRSLEVSPDSGLGCDSLCGSAKDSVILDVDEDMPAQSSSGTKRPFTPETAGVRLCPSAGSSHQLWQSTPVYDDAQTTSQVVFPESCDYEISPTKRRRASNRKPSRDISRDIFQSSRRRGTLIYQQPHMEDSPCTSQVSRPSFAGRSSVDFLYHLGKRTIHQPALDAIFKCLEPADLCRASMVSKAWKAIIEGVPVVMRRKQEHVDKCSQIKENLHQSVKKAGGVLPYRGQLIEVQNFNTTKEVNTSGARSPPVSPSKVRFNLFLKEGLKLESGQTLIQCPQCKLPARKEAERAARCTRRGCQFYFCILCLCKFHSDKLCPVSSVKHRKHQAAIGSRESRRNLQRLCK